MRQLRWTRLQIERPWHGFLLPVDSFPLTAERRGWIASCLETFCDSFLGSNGSLHREVFLHQWKLHLENTGDLYAEHLQEWRPQLGMGMWPDRKPPARWNQETFADASAAVLSGGEPALNSYGLVHLSGSTPARSQAAKALFGNGVLMQIFSDLEFSDLQNQTRAVFLPQIVDRSFRRERFYIPLLQASTACNASAVQLDRWLGGSFLYLRESWEDAAIFLLCRKDIAAELVAAGFEVEQSDFVRTKET
jgi:hypothetical protein